METSMPFLSVHLCRAKASRFSQEMKLLPITYDELSIAPMSSYITAAGVSGSRTNGSSLVLFHVVARRAVVESCYLLIQLRYVRPFVS